VILVTELTRWGRSMLDLLHTLQDLQARNVSLIAQTGLQLDFRSAQGKLIASLMAALAEFERDLLRERVRSGIAAARKRGVVPAGDLVSGSNRIVLRLKCCSSSAPASPIVKSVTGSA
jgi:DNA invertase Pin-like site-specific DNA recombinase